MPVFLYPNAQPVCYIPDGLLFSHNVPALYRKKVHGYRCHSYLPYWRRGKLRILLLCTLSHRLIRLRKVRVNQEFLLLFLRRCVPMLCLSESPVAGQSVLQDRSDRRQSIVRYGNFCFLPVRQWVYSFLRIYTFHWMGCCMVIGFMVALLNLISSFNTALLPLGRIVIAFSVQLWPIFSVSVYILELAVGSLPSSV